METKGKVRDWTLSIPEAVGALGSSIALAVAVTVYSLTTFQSKEAAAEMKKDIERRIDSVESEIQTIRASIDGVAKDVSYIRGKIENVKFNVDSK